MRRISRGDDHFVVKSGKGKPHAFNTTGLSDAEKKKRTLTNLYNAPPTWLDLARKRLDEAVFAAYGWKSDLSDEVILGKYMSCVESKCQGDHIAGTCATMNEDKSI